MAAAALVSGCTTQNAQNGGKPGTSVASTSTRSSTYAYTPRDKECLERAMFFESNRSSKDGLIAVGTVVMNRLDSGKWGNTICGVVGQKGQFAPGVLTRKMKSSALPDVQAAADAVLKGQRNPKVKNAMFFHTAGLRFPYKNMHYTVVAGGNAFYEKRSRNHSAVIASREASRAVANAYIASLRMRGQQNVQVASADTGPIATPTGARVVQQQQQQPVQVASAEIDPRPMAFTTERPAAQGAAEANTLQAQGQAVQANQSQAGQENIQTASAPAGMLAYEAPTSESVDAIGQMLLAQDRPAL
ncbi:cell wall hydrolase [Phyllobacterium sp. 21LDTY02-6]|uniref:cell wall hydrolase n=1 Tax=Phyllobacterium sp. 21LDTY02-6 TaxID=2944903 RepID=UPI0020206E10|nr:cell wall hydrolase [Phyllobacterium sp. 21LDTY02-6]MCO4315758.1 cell wall hydrolase [Phyllobacterium sp. 21LDTY02-6]